MAGLAGNELSVLVDRFLCVGCFVMAGFTGHQAGFSFQVILVVTALNIVTAGVAGLAGEVAAFWRHVHIQRVVWIDH